MSRGNMKSHLLVLFIAWAIAIGWAGSSAAQESYDLVIRHGRVIDGTGNPSFHADLAITGNRIAKVGHVAEAGKKEIDATGLVVAPGFIDVHTHAENLADLPKAENFARMGVTTLILGNCGDSALEVGKLLDQLEDMTVSVNAATLLGHGTIRKQVMGGSFMRPPTAEELSRMKAWVDRGMKEGAVGISTGLIYLPGTFAKTEELIELAKVAAAHEGIYVSHMRNEGDEIFRSLEELFRIAREAKIRAEVSHIKLSGKPSWGQAEAVLNKIAEARSQGLDITQDMYVYPASSTGISQLVPAEAREGDGFAKRLTDPKEKAKIVEAMKVSIKEGNRAGYDYAMIASYEADPSLNGLTLVEAAKRKRGSSSVEDQIELVLEIHGRGGASGVFHSMDEEDVRRFLRCGNTMIGSDSSVRIFNLGVPHPRGYGNTTRLLGRYVRELHLLGLEDAIRRMTSLPAGTFRLRDRGQLREGAWADVVVFDPEKIKEEATFEAPHKYAVGFKAVIVNGEPVVMNDKHTGSRPGQALRHVP